MSTITIIFLSLIAFNFLLLRFSYNKAQKVKEPTIPVKQPLSVAKTTKLISEEASPTKQLMESQLSPTGS